MADNCKLCRIALENVSVVRGGQTLLQDVSMQIGRASCRERV